MKIRFDKLLHVRSTALLLLAVAGVTTVRAQTEDSIVALVGGRKITQREVDRSVASQIFPLQQQVYALRKVALENLILRAVLENEARKRGLAVEELGKQLTSGRVEVLPSQVEQAYLENASAFGTMSPDEARERLRLDLENQARMKNYREALSKLRASSGVELRLEEPKVVSAAEAEAGASVGPEKAAVTITEFSDFQCPYCKQAQGTIKRVLQNYADDVRLVFKHLPLGMHAQAFPAARAAFCAGEQGSFWQYHDALFASESMSPEVFTRLATELRLDMPRFNACVDSEAARMAVLRDMHDARRLGISGTPAFVINGKLFRGALNFEDFKGVVERELKSARNSPAGK